jgi:signal transduction histidine kinase
MPRSASNSTAQDEPAPAWRPQDLVFLLEASRVLASTLDYERTLRAVARLAVPHVADWCAIDLRTGAGLERLAVAHVDEAKVSLAQQLHERYPPALDAAYGVAAVLRTGRAELVAEIPDALLEAGARDAEHLRILRALRLRSYMMVPLVVGDEAIGAISFVSAESGRRYGAADLQIAEELARRAGAAIQNARLHAASLEARQALEHQAMELEMQAEELQAQSMEMECVQAELEAANHDLQQANTRLEAQVAREEALRAEAEAERRRADFLAEASRILSASLDYRDTLRSIARAAAPGLADWCAVDVLHDPESADWPPRLERVAVHHEDPARVAWAEELARRVPIDWTAGAGVPQVLRTRKAEFYPEISDETLVSIARDEAHLTLLRQIDFTSAIIAPLCSRDRCFGVLTLCTTGSQRHFTERDHALALDVAHRAAQAIDHARTHAAEQESRGVAERLQAMTSALSEAATSEQVSAAVMEYGLGALNADFGVLALLLPDGTELEIARSIGYPKAACMGPGRRWPLVAPIPIAESVRTLAPVFVESPGQWAERYRSYAPTGSSAAWAAVPLLREREAAGALLWTYTAPREFTARDRGLMLTIGRLASQALDRARLFEAERDARAEAEEANRAKAQFLSAMSHELRTPLNAIGGYTELLAMGIHGETTPAQRLALERIQRSQQVLLGLINDVLSFARVEAGHLDFQLQPLVVDSLMERVEAVIEPQAVARGITLRREPAPDIHAIGDAERVTQILLNLLANAVKFTEPGGSVDLSAERDGGAVCVHVADTGRGIPAGQLNSVFDPFVQLERHRTEQSQQGIGLGLAISRELARGMGGDVRVRSEEGIGSTFTLTVPGAD